MRARLKNQSDCSSRSKEAEISGIFSRDQSLVTSAATNLKHALRRETKGSKRGGEQGSCSLSLPAFGVLLLAGLCGCATPHFAATPDARGFDFQKDTFAYPNELVWEYHYDAAGKWTTHRREPKPTYTLHCFVVARSARQFFENARFAPELPRATEATYRRLIRRVVSVNPRRPLPETRRIVIPGYADLRAFSDAQEKLLKAGCGGAWQSYSQRGNWRMVSPFTRHQQQRMAERLQAHLTPNHPLIVHLVRFPQLTINHAVVIFDVKETDQGLQFVIYDPNQPEKPGTLQYERATRTFLFPANSWFPGGRVDVYEVYWKWDY